MKNRAFYLLLAIFFSGIGGSFTQTQRQSVPDSLLHYKAVWDSNHRLLSWHAPETPGKAYDHVINLASEFLLNIPSEPQTGFKMHQVLCCFEGPGLHNVGEEGAPRGIMPVHWPNNPACVNAGAVHSFADKYYYYTGKGEYINMVRDMLDMQIEWGSTPEGWFWEKVPYASADALDTIFEGGKLYEHDEYRGDGLHVIEPDKVGELGYAYLRFYQITGEEKYLNAAINCADALAENVRIINLNPNPHNRDSLGIMSPWPFRVNARTNFVISQYTANITEPIKLFNELIRTADRIELPQNKLSSYQQVRDYTWQWLYSVNGPMKTYIWAQYFEDVGNDEHRITRNQVTPIEWAKYLIENPEMDTRLDIHIPAIIYWVLNTFGDPQVPAILEQTWCYEPMGSHSARYGSACAMWYEKTGNDWFKDQAFQTLNYATYMTWENGVVSVGHKWRGSWFSDGYTDYVRHFIDAMAAIPEWAPADRNHLLRTSSVITDIKYTAASIQYSTYDLSGEEKLRLTRKPRSVKVNGVELPAMSISWKRLDKGGVLTLTREAGDKVVITL